MYFQVIWALSEKSTVHYYDNAYPSPGVKHWATLRDDPHSMNPPKWIHESTQEFRERNAHEMLNTYACQHLEFQGPGEKFLKVLSRKKQRNKKG